MFALSSISLLEGAAHWPGRNFGHSQHSSTHSTAPPLPYCHAHWPTNRAKFWLIFKLLLQWKVRENWKTRIPTKYLSLSLYVCVCVQLFNALNLLAGLKSCPASPKSICMPRNSTATVKTIHTKWWDDTDENCPQKPKAESQSQTKRTGDPNTNTSCENNNSPNAFSDHFWDPKWENE